MTRSRLADLITYSAQTALMMTLLKDAGYSPYPVSPFIMQQLAKIDARLATIEREIANLTATRAYVTELWRERGES